MMSRSDAEQAEMLSTRRARALPAVAIIFLTQQIAYFTGAGTGDRAVDRVHVVAWMVLSAVVILALLTGGGWVYSRRVRALANDEGTRANRDDALRMGFAAAMGMGLLLYAISLFEPLEGREAIHIVMTAGLGVALLRMALLERRATANG